MKSFIKEKIKDLFILIAIFIIFEIARSGIYNFLFFIPKDWNSSSVVGEFTSARFLASIFLAMFLLGYVYYKYEKMQNEIYKWKNRDKIENAFNKHLFKKEDEE